MTDPAWRGPDSRPRFDEWVRDRRGSLFVMVAADEVIGVGRLARLSDTEGWLEGLRVAVPWQRRGVGSGLIRHRLRHAVSLGLTTVRAVTYSGNVAAQRALRSAGLERVATMRAWRADAEPGVRPAAATLIDVPAIWKLVVRSRAKTGGVLVQAGPFWAWRALTLEDVRRAVANGGCMVVRDRDRVDAAAILGTSADDRLTAFALFGQRRAAGGLVDALRAEASARELPGVEIVTDASWTPLLRELPHFRARPGAALIYQAPS